MQIARLKHNGVIHWAVIEGKSARLLRNDPYKKIRYTSCVLPLRRATLLPPATPSKIILVGLNYREHARELEMRIPQEPILFLKPPSSLIGNNGRIVYPPGVKRLDYEAELAVVIKKSAKNISPQKAGEYIFGVSCLNDVTARDLQAKDGQWTRAKSFDTFCPLGPWVQTDINTNDLKIQLYLNGELRQDSSTADFIFPVSRIVSFASRIMTLFAGDIISTGTPKGVGAMKRGDVVEVKIDHIGVLKNRVA
ncbi:MAG: fumarylacetoacetate hydrolase family protein [Candidatus Omnitrophota bacterium]|nr:MAG: fumarylacetoacetate hydrolase family protein [Candidatus Omnitrophota bacterium]